MKGKWASEQSFTNTNKSSLNKSCIKLINHPVITLWKGSLFYKMIHHSNSSCIASKILDVSWKHFVLCHRKDSRFSKSSQEVKNQDSILCNILEVKVSVKIPSCFLLCFWPSGVRKLDFHILQIFSGCDFKKKTEESKINWSPVVRQIASLPLFQNLYNFLSSLWYSQWFTM